MQRCLYTIIIFAHCGVVCAEPKQLTLTPQDHPAFNAVCIAASTSTVLDFVTRGNINLWCADKMKRFESGEPIVPNNSPPVGKAPVVPDGN